MVERDQNEYGAREEPDDLMDSQEGSAQAPAPSREGRFGRDALFEAALSHLIDHPCADGVRRKPSELQSYLDEFVFPFNRRRSRYPLLSIARVSAFIQLIQIHKTIGQFFFLPIVHLLVSG